ncbi:DJ-1/PfpI family protein [Kribbella sp. NPDC049227]|uniref:DJ-1/PfpI family protein n=1 Tax=Kribbella sp. NPDC049227 TaxID=3364113 RepID=UPI0037165AF2
MSPPLPSSASRRPRRPPYFTVKRFRAGVDSSTRGTGGCAARPTDLRNAGATWVDQEVATDENLITSRNPDETARWVPVYGHARSL